MHEYFSLPSAALAFPDISPVIVHIGPLAVHWYGVGYVVGILFAWWYAKRLVVDTRLWPGGVLPIKPEDLDDFIVWAAVGVVLGGRTAYVLFYDPPRYLARPLDGLVLFVLLRALTHSQLKLKTPGFVGGVFVAAYGVSRIFVEFFREPDAQLGYLLGGWLTMGMVLSLPMVLIGIWAMAKARPVSQALQ